MLKTLRRLLSPGSRGNAAKAGLTTAPRFAVFLPARLLLSVTPSGAPVGRRSIASTVNVSETGLAIALPAHGWGGRRVAAGDRLDVELDIYPSGVVAMTCEVVWHRPFEAESRAGHLAGVKITEMSHTDRARYLEYLATHGWEQAAGVEGQGRESRPSDSPPAEAGRPPEEPGV